jgi:hypothetical protein
MRGEVGRAIPDARGARQAGSGGNSHRSLLIGRNAGGSTTAALRSRRHPLDGEGMSRQLALHELGRWTYVANGDIERRFPAGEKTNDWW